jgi:hypothetical protein
MALPFVLLPLLAITASKHWMSTDVLPPSPAEDETEADLTRREEHRLQSTTEASSSSSLPPRASAAVEKQQRWSFQPALLLRWSWWTRGAGQVVEEKQSRSLAPTGETGFLSERTDSYTSPPGRASGLDSQARLSTHFANGWLTVGITSGIYVIIVISNVYVIVTTALGTGGT